MNQLGGFPLLTLIVFLPGLSAIITALIPAEKKQIWRWLAFLIAAANLFISLFLYMGWIDNPEGDLQFVDGPSGWIPSLGIRYHLGIDGINIHLVMLTTFVTPLVLLLVWSQSERSHVVWILLLQVGVLGALVSFDLIMFFAFWLLTRLTTFFLLGSDAEHAMKPRSAQTRMQFLIATAIAATLISIVIAGLLTQQSNLSLSQLIETPLAWKPQAWMFWCVAVAMGITSGAFPLVHFVDLNHNTFSATQVLVSSLLVNLGGYGLIRFGMSLFPLAATRFAPMMIVLGTVGLLYGAIVAAASSSLGNTLVYWNMAQMGLAVIGMFSLQDLGMHGALVGFLGRGLGTAALLMLPRSKNWLKNHTTLTAIALAYLSLIGMPGLAGFAGQSALLVGVLRWHWQISASPTLNSLIDWTLYGAIALGLVIGMWALFRTWRRLWQDASAVAVQAALAPRTLIAIPVLIALLVVGLHPQSVSSMIGPSVYRFLNDIEIGAQKSLLEAGQSEQNDLSAPSDPSPPVEKASLPWPKTVIGPLTVSSVSKAK